VFPVWSQKTGNVDPGGVGNELFDRVAAESHGRFGGRDDQLPGVCHSRVRIPGCEFDTLSDADEPRRARVVHT
jgi:hypothetical protein